MSTKTAPELPLATSKEQILGIQDREYEYHAIPEWSVRVKIIALTGTERGQYESTQISWKSNGKGGLEMAPGNTANSKIRLAALSIVDEDNKRLFADADIAALGDKSAAALERVVDVAMRLSRFSSADMEALKESLKAEQNGSDGSG